VAHNKADWASNREHLRQQNEHLELLQRELLMAQVSIGRSIPAATSNELSNGKKEIIVTTDSRNFNGQDSTPVTIFSKKNFSR
jgi:hypothetical protein